MGSMTRTLSKLENSYKNSLNDIINEPGFEEAKKKVADAMREVPGSDGIKPPDDGDTEEDEERALASEKQPVRKMTIQEIPNLTSDN